MLQKGFFMVKPFNPNPYWDNKIVNLNGAQKFEQNTVFEPGRYRIYVGAGGVINKTSGSIEYNHGGSIYRTISIPQKFLIRAYCGGGSIVDYTTSSIEKQGINLYSGQFKVNGVADKNTTIPSVNHIFGNAGSAGATQLTIPPYYIFPVVSSGNCLGDGAIYTLNRLSASGAGSCLHIIPEGGTFGSNYLFAFHCSGAAGEYNGIYGGGGSAYGGAASGGSSLYGTTDYTKAGGSTPYGTGGAGVMNSVGNVGTGYGAGKNNGQGSAAYFNGTYWSNVTGTNDTNEGRITVEYLGTLN